MAQDDPAIGQDAHDDSTPAKVVQNAGRKARPGGGGLGGSSAASDPPDQSGRAAGGASPNSPIDIEAPHPEGSPDAIGHEAAQRAAGDAPEPRPGSQ